jgi:hypothetical protein
MASTPALLPTEEDQMEFVQAHFAVQLQSLQNNRIKVFAAVEEDFNRADQYAALARKSHRELAALGLSHEDPLRFIGLA